MPIANQILLFTVILSLSIVLLFIGYQVYQILSEIRKMIMKFNKITDNAVDISNNLGASFNNFGSFTQGLKSIFGLLNLFKRKPSEPEA